MGPVGLLMGLIQVGGLAEKRTEGSNLGPTFAYIIGKTFAVDMMETGSSERI